ncbi:MAG: hypothetical protein WAW86_05970 [Gammaproteobacteria bacterium]
MPLTINHFIKTAVIFSCSSCIFAQTFMGVEQSTSLKMQPYKAPAPAVQPMSAQDFKGTVGSLSEQTQNTVSQGINKKLLPPPAPMPTAPTTAQKPPSTPDASTSTSVTNNPTLPTQVAPTQIIAPTVTNPPINNMPPPTSNNMAPANPTPSSTPVYSGFQGTGTTTNTNTAPPPRSGGSNNNNAPAKSSGWNINY